MSAVNRQLQAQLEGADIRAVALPANGRGTDDMLAVTQEATIVAPSRRQNLGESYIEQLEMHGESGSATLRRTPKGTYVVVEGGRRREVKSGILGAAIERALGRAAQITKDELDTLPAGVPVEVLEGPTGAPFVVIAGRRWPIRGLPLPHPVRAEHVQVFPEGDELNVAFASVPRTRLDDAMYGRYQIARFKAAARRSGAVGLARKTASKAKRKL
ncbi:MAG TPA: hypothetical protein VFX21_10675, partial [Acidimicrobiia bacterium]|nr:hypothetical protein [Acidimicrobiia bacterium]